MSCEICGRNNCTRSFHSIEEQENFDNVADDIKCRLINIISKKIDSIDGHYDESDNYWIKLNDALDAVDSCG